MEGNKKIIYINDWETTNTNTTTTTQENFDIEQEVLEETGTYQSMPKRDIMMEAKRPVSFEGQEVDPMSDYVSKDAFEAHMRRIDDRVSSMETLLVERMGSMEERIENKIGNLTNSVDRLVTSVEDQRKEIHSDNLATRISNYAVIATAVVGFIAIMVTLMR